MKNNTPVFRSPAQWEELISRYYEGLTSREEENDLRDYMQRRARKEDESGPDCAVFAYVAMARQEHERTCRKRKIYRLAASVAAAAMIAGIIWSGFGRSDENVCEFYVGGKRYTDFNEAKSRMESTLKQIQTEPVSVEERLGNMFDGLDL